jgi:conjugative relaxase-like TrwC/TraI family protein
MGLLKALGWEKNYKPPSGVPWATHNAAFISIPPSTLKEAAQNRGEVRTEDFEKLAQGMEPHSGEFLRPRHSADRIGGDGSTQSRGRDLYDFTFSAPKSVSMMAALGDDERLVKVHA